MKTFVVAVVVFVYLLTSSAAQRLSTCVCCCCSSADSTLAARCPRRTPSLRPTTSLQVRPRDVTTCSVGKAARVEEEVRRIIETREMERVRDVTRRTAGTKKRQGKRKDETIRLNEHCTCTHGKTRKSCEIASQLRFRASRSISDLELHTPNATRWHTSETNTGKPIMM